MSKNSADIQTTQQTLPASRPGAAEIQHWLISHLAEALQVDPETIDRKAPFDRYGLDSFVAVNLVGELEEWLRCELSPTLPYEYPTVESLARHLSEFRI